jgi:hypothetical protein
MIKREKEKKMDTVKTNIERFVFSNPEACGYGTEVGYFFAKDKEADKYPTILGYVRKDEKTSKYSISHVGPISSSDYNSVEHIKDIPYKFRPIFETKEDAAKGLYVLYACWKANPIPPDMLAYLNNQWREYGEKRHKLISQFFDIENERKYLSQLAKKCGVDFGESVDIKERVADLIKFMDDNNDDMYDLIGKDFARSLRSRVAAVVRIVDPVAANYI